MGAMYCMSVRTLNNGDFKNTTSSVLTTTSTSYFIWSFLPQFFYAFILGTWSGAMRKGWITSFYLDSTLGTDIIGHLYTWDLVDVSNCPCVSWKLSWGLGDCLLWTPLEVPTMWLPFLLLTLYLSALSCSGLPHTDPPFVKAQSLLGKGSPCTLRRGWLGPPENSALLSLPLRGCNGLRAACFLSLCSPTVLMLLTTFRMRVLVL